jgi:Family of unknown function (DUF6152)
MRVIIRGIRLVDQGRATKMKYLQIRGVSRTILGLLLFWMVTPVFAHHSVTSEFDPDKEFSVTGVLTRVAWTNPHVYWWVDVKDESGNIVTYSFEGNPPGMYHRAGLHKDDWKIGEVVTVTAVAAKDGTKHLGFGKVIKYSDGHSIVLKVGGE